MVLTYKDIHEIQRHLKNECEKELELSSKITLCIINIFYIRISLPKKPKNKNLLRTTGVHMKKMDKRSLSFH